VFDYVVVGAGSAGCVLAARLSEDPATDVLLLEAGPRDRKLEIRIPAAFSKLYGSAVDWAYRTVPQENLDGREIYVPLGKTLGGSSSINAQMVLRGHAADQEAWQAPGWGWPEAEQAYARSSGAFLHEPLRDPSPLTHAFVAAAEALGIPPSADLNGHDNSGVGLVPVSQRRGRRWSVADGYLRPALRRPNLTVATGARAVRIILDRGRAAGVAYRLDGREEEAPARRDVIVSCGAINSPQLLLLSGIGPREAIEGVGLELVHELPGVGRNLRDHLANGIFCRTHDAMTLFTAESWRNLVRWLVRRRGPLCSNVGEAVAFVRTRPELAAPDLELLFAPVLFTDEGLSPPPEDGVTIAAVALQPGSVGEVSLRSADPNDPPLVDPRYLSDPGDADVLVQGVRLARRIAAQEPLARHISEELAPGSAAVSDEDILAHVRALSQTLYHPVGTCRLGTDDAAVVDPLLRVRGVEGLRVVDASVMPRSPRGHTNWPTVMIAERAVELIRGT
jgi:choline dehydrogenase-like flavoprotein